LVRRTDYKKLEVHHGYIQWLFPNFYGSAFNRDAFKLLPEEANIFRENKEVTFGKGFSSILRLQRDLLSLMS
jgi:Opioid growth factor receptor (OGFr) conserved region.